MKCQLTTFPSSRTWVFVNHGSGLITGAQRTTSTQWRPFVRSFKTDSGRVTKNYDSLRPKRAHLFLRSTFPPDPQKRKQGHEDEVHPDPSSPVSNFVPGSPYRSEIGSELKCKAATHPENTPPISTRKALITIWNQNWVEPGSGTPSFLGMLAETPALMASLAKGTPSAVGTYDKRGARGMSIQGGLWAGRRSDMSFVEYISPSSAEIRAGARDESRPDSLRVVCLYQTGTRQAGVHMVLVRVAYDNRSCFRSLPPTTALRKNHLFFF